MAVLKVYDTRSIIRRYCEVAVSELARGERIQSKERSELDKEEKTYKYFIAFGSLQALVLLFPLLLSDFILLNVTTRPARTQGIDTSSTSVEQRKIKNRRPP